MSNMINQVNRKLRSKSKLSQTKDLKMKKYHLLQSQPHFTCSIFNCLLTAIRVKS